MAELIGDKTPATAELLGELFGYAELTRAALRTAEAEAFEWGNGVWFPNGDPLVTAAPLPASVDAARERDPAPDGLAQPAGDADRVADQGPRAGPLLAKYLQGAGGASAETRIRVFRLAWDFAASALGSRGEQYERFYLASAARNRMLAHLFAPKDRSRKLVDRFLEEKSE